MILSSLLLGTPREEAADGIVALARLEEGPELTITVQKRIEEITVGHPIPVVSPG